MKKLFYVQFCGKNMFFLKKLLIELIKSKNKTIILYHTPIRCSNVGRE